MALVPGARRSTLKQITILRTQALSAGSPRGTAFTPSAPAPVYPRLYPPADTGHGCPLSSWQGGGHPFRRALHYGTTVVSGCPFLVRGCRRGHPVPRETGAPPPDFYGWSSAQLCWGLLWVGGWVGARHVVLFNSAHALCFVRALPIDPLS